MDRPARAQATRAGLALEAERLQAERQAVAIQGERERIARDMHDGLAQVLGYVNAKSQAVEGLLAEGRVDEARHQLGELAAAARSIHADVREEILNLSTPLTAGRDLAGALEEYGRRSAQAEDFAVRFSSTPDVAAVSLPAEVRAEVLRIAREALTNVRKHARAGLVSIDLQVEGSELVLRVQDDGSGFETEVQSSGPDARPHFGLRSMRERAESIGGRIEWRSRPGAGTEVELRVPVEDAARLSPAGSGSA
jgi:signal transduction histidine kinase